MSTTTPGAEVLTKKSFNTPDETRTFAHGRIDVATAGGHTVGRARFEPGWRWSQSVKPLVNTELCEASHLVYVISGRMAIRMKDGTELEFGPGDLMYAPPQHDAWIVGDETFEAVDFTGAPTYAKR